MLYSICQRYNFESNLQLIAVNALILYCCIRYVKDTILKAIYNVLFSHYINLSLYSICQRYNFESNLQLYKARRQICNRCIRYVKDTILKAIYNLIVLYLYTVRAVFDMSKIQFWKQFTTLYFTVSVISKLYSICQRYNFESNLQP